MEKTITAVILAGGRGDRLKLQEPLPKPMVKLNKKPLLEYVIRFLKKNNINNIIISVCYLPQVITEYFKDGKKFGVNISYIYENQNKPLGTAGSIAQLKKKLKKTFIVCYGDSLRSFDLNLLLQQHFLAKPSATICVYKNLKPDPKSAVVFDNKNAIQSFVERPSVAKSLLVWSNAGFYVFEPEVFKYIRKNKKTDFGKNIFPLMIKNKKQLQAFALEGYFLDVGTKEKVSIAQRDIKKGKLAW